jgi:antitoxin component YwqK of YwqJK toxin-antitoxin module
MSAIWGAVWVSLALAGAGERCPVGQLFQRIDLAAGGHEEGCATPGTDGAHKKQGEWVTYRADGGKELLLTYENGALEGPWVTWHRRGQSMASAGAYRKGLREGLRTEWFESGQKKEEATYVGGQPVGVRTTWYASGQREAEWGIVEGLWTATREWYENGQTKFELVAASDAASPDRWTRWYEDGRKKAAGHARKGKWVGLATYWHPDGRKQREGEFADGRREGTWTEWHANGQKKSVTTYRSDEEEGLATTWYADGRRESEAYYEGGELTRSTHWDRNGVESVFPPLAPAR